MESKKCVGERSNRKDHNAGNSRRSNRNNGTTSTRFKIRKRTNKRKTALTLQQVKESKAQINKWAEEVAQGWKKLDIESQNSPINYLNYKVNNENATTNSRNAERKLGVDKTKVEAETNSLIQGISNQKAQEKLIKAEAGIKEIQLEVRAD